MFTRKCNFFFLVQHELSSCFLRVPVEQVLAETTPHVNQVSQVKDTAVYAPLDSPVKIVNMVRNIYRIDFQLGHNKFMYLMSSIIIESH